MTSKKKNKFITKKNSEEGYFPNANHSIDKNKTIVPIKGMHCRSCEILICEKLEEIPEIKNAQVSYKKGQALIYSKTPLDMRAVESAVEEAGYEVGVDDSKDWITRDPAKYRDLAVAFVILLVLYIIAKKLGIASINVGGSSGNPSSLLVVLIIGLTAGISTCMALVGGLVLGISARFSEKHPEATPVQKFRPHIFFVTGRIISYFVLGGVIGLAGKAFQLSGPSLGILTIIVGFVMLTLGAQLTEMFPRLSSGGLTLPPSVAKFFGIKKRHQKEYSHTNSMMTGALTFFLPCGFTQAMQLYAMSTGSFWRGAMIMGAFALGTAPGLLGIGGLTSVIQGAFAKKFFKFAGLLVAALAVFNISNGWNLTGWKVSLPSFSSDSTKSATSDNNTADDPNVIQKDGVQVVNMTQSSGGYSPNSFTIKKGIPVKWVVNSTDSRTCAASLVFSKFGIRKALKSGENTIEFTPTETGEYKFSCSMGMYRGVFKVVEDTEAKVSENFNTSTQPIEPAPSQAPASQTSPQSQTVQPKAETPSSASSSTTQNSNTDQVQVIKSTFFAASYTDNSDLKPNDFTVKANQPVRFEIAAEVDGEGCMSTIMIPGLINEPELFEKGKTVVFNFTPTKKGTYDITCAMGVPRGTLKVV